MFPDFNKPFLLETDASKEGLGVVLSQKQDDGHYHPVVFGSRTLMQSEQNYHSSKLEFLALKWSITEHFKEYLAYALFTVCTDNNPLTYMLTTPNLDAMGHRWVGALASYEFSLEYQKGSDNAAADTLSRVPIWHDRKTVRSLLEGYVTGVTERGEVLISRPLRAECNCLDNEAWAHALKMAPMHITNWEEVQCEDALLAACHKWLSKKKSVIPQKSDALLKECMGEHLTCEEGKALFHVRNSLTLRKGLMYVNIMPKGETEGLLAFIVPSAHRRTALNGVHRDTRHQGQQRTLALAEEHFWWPKMVEDCRALVKGCQHCQIFEGVVVKAPLCPIKAFAPLELVHMDFMSIETTMELNQPPSVKNVLVITDHFMRYSMAFVTKDQKAKTVARILYERFIAIFGTPAKLLSDRGANFTSALVEELCSAFGIQKCRTMAYHAQCNGQVERFHQTLFRMIRKLSADKKAQWECISLSSCKHTIAPDLR